MISLKRLLSEIRADKAELESEEELPPIQRSFVKKDIYKKYVGLFRGLKISVQEADFLKTFGTKPTRLPIPNKDTECVWGWTDLMETKNYVLTLKKLKQFDKFSYCTFFSEKTIEPMSLKEQEEQSKPEQTSDQKTDKPKQETDVQTDLPKKDDKEKEKQKDTKDSIKISISQPFDTVDGDLNILKKLLTKLQIGKNKKF